MIAYAFIRGRLRPFIIVERCRPGQNSWRFMLLRSGYGWSYGSCWRCYAELHRRFLESK